jgi:hypothetical protein
MQERTKNNNSRFSRGNVKQDVLPMGELLSPWFLPGVSVTARLKH